MKCIGDVALVVVVSLVFIGFAPPSGRCAGAGNQTYPTQPSTWTLSCTGECELCTAGPHTNGDGDQYCGCSAENEPACCHLILKNPGTSNAEWGTNGDCPSCGAQGICSTATDSNGKKVAACVPVLPG